LHSCRKCFLFEAAISSLSIPDGDDAPAPVHRGYPIGAHVVKNVLQPVPLATR
jgi:hypothetical protein